MAAVMQGELDRILANNNAYSQSKILKDFFNDHDTVELRATGELRFRHGGREYHVTQTRGIHCSPRLAVQLLSLHGYRGVYYGRDRRTMVSKSRAQMMREEDREYYAKRGITLDFQFDYLYHFDEEHQEAEREQMEAERRALEEERKRLEKERATLEAEKAKQAAATAQAQPAQSEQTTSADNNQSTTKSSKKEA